MQKVLLFVAFTFISFNIKAQSIQLDSMVSYRDSLSETPSVKDIYQYNDEGIHTKTINWSTVTSGGIEEFKLTDIDSFIYNALGQLSEIKKFAPNNGDYIETGRSFFEYDADGNIIRYEVQVKYDSGSDWDGLWLSEYTYEDGLLVESLNSFKNPANGLWARNSREEYFYDSDTELLVQRDGYSYDFTTQVEEPFTRDVYFYNADGFLEETEQYRYDEDEFSFYLFSTSDFIRDEFGNNIRSFTSRVDSNGVETSSYMSDKVYDTNVEVDEVNFPASTGSFRSSKHIILESSNVFWEDEEWVLNSNFVYYYSGVTGTKDHRIVEDLQMFPNPASSTIFFGDNEVLGRGNSVFQITGLDGSLIYKGKLNQNHFDVSNIASGKYNVMIQNGDVLWRGRFIKI